MNSSIHLRTFKIIFAGILVLITSISSVGGKTIQAAESNPTVTSSFWPFFSYRFVAGSSLHSADYSMRQVYNSGSCISVLDTGNEFLNVHLQLPDGSRIDYLRLFFYDTNASFNGTASIRKYDGAGNYVEIASVSSTGSSGYGTTLSPFANHVVDNSTGGYVINWLPNTTGSTMRLCGLRVAYRLAAYPMFLPLTRR